MGKGDSKSVGSIEWLRVEVETEEQPHHGLHLALVALAITRNCHFHSSRGIESDIKIGVRRGEHRRCPRLSDRQGRLGLDCSYERLFDCNLFRRVLGDYCAQSLVDG